MIVHDKRDVLLDPEEVDPGATQMPRAEHGDLPVVAALSRQGSGYLLEILRERVGIASAELQQRRSHRAVQRTGFATRSNLDNGDERVLVRIDVTLEVNE